MVGDKAQPEVRKAIERWKQQGEDGVLLYWLLGSGTPPYKMDKNKARYQNSPSGDQRCDNCEFAYSKLYRQAANLERRYICSQIDGPVIPRAWCRMWRKGSLL